jgi:hypothetical protein
MSRYRLYAVTPTYAAPVSSLSVFVLGQTAESGSVTFLVILVVVDRSGLV